MPDNTVAVYLIDIAGRDVKVKQPTETQLILMGRAAKKAQKAAQDERMTEALYSMVDALDIVDYLIVDEDDRGYITDLMSRGELQIDELITAIGEVAPKPERTTGPATRVTRGKAQ